MKFAIVKILCFIFILHGLCGAESKFLLLAGPSGIGKSTAIKALQSIDDRFVYIKPYTTRPLRPGETDKVHMPLDQIMELQSQGKLVALNHLFGNYYATPLDPILDALDRGAFPVLDWPVGKVDHMKGIFKERVVTIFLYVDDIEQLASQLKLDARDKTGERFATGKMELEAFFRGDYDRLIDYRVKNDSGDPMETAKKIYQTYKEAIELQP